MENTEKKWQEKQLTEDCKGGDLTDPAYGPSKLNEVEINQKTKKDQNIKHTKKDASLRFYKEAMQISRAIVWPNDLG